MHTFFRFPLWLQGAQEIIQELPHEYVSPNDLKEVCETGGELELVTLVIRSTVFIRIKRMQIK